MNLIEYKNAHFFLLVEDSDRRIGGAKKYGGNVRIQN